MTPVEGPAKTCTLTGHFTYTPEVLGRAAIELSVEAPSVRGATGTSSQRAYAHVLAKEPRLAIAVSRLKPGRRGTRLRFPQLGQRSGHGGSLATRLSTRLRVDVQSTDWAGTGQSRPWKTTLRLLRHLAADAPWIMASSGGGGVDLRTSR